MISIKVVIHWIPSHAEIGGNKQADILAKQATGWRKEGTGQKAPTFPSLQSLSAAAKRHKSPNGSTLGEGMGER